MSKSYDFEWKHTIINSGEESWWKCFSFVLAISSSNGWVTKKLHKTLDHILNLSNKDRRCGKILSDWKTVINVGIVRGYPPSTVDITAN